MKISKLVLSVLLLPAMAWAQTPNFSLTGKIGNLGKPAMAYIDYMDNGLGHEDSVALVNGSLPAMFLAIHMHGWRSIIQEEEKEKRFTLAT